MPLAWTDEPDNVPILAETLQRLCSTAVSKRTANNRKDQCGNDEDE